MKETVTQAVKVVGIFITIVSILKSTMELYIQMEEYSEKYRI